MAERVASMPEPSVSSAPGVQEKCADCPDGVRVQRQVEPEEEEEASERIAQPKLQVQRPIGYRMPGIQRLEEGESLDELMERSLGQSPKDRLNRARDLYRLGVITKEELEAAENEYRDSSVVQPKLLSGQTAIPNLQRQEDGGVPYASDELTGRLSSSKGAGQALPDQVQRTMGQAFGQDFSGVRVHTDAEAVQMNEGLSARAFTHGSDIYFNRGEYSPDSSEGKKLLGHELTHVVQQSGSLQFKRNIIQLQPIDCENRAITGVTDPNRDLQQEVIDAHNLALEYARLALEQVENIREGNPVRGIIRSSFNLHFNNPSQTHITRIRNRLRAAVTRLNRGTRAIYRCNRGGSCRNGNPDAAQMCPSGGFRTRICPHFFQIGPIERARALLHESIHAVGGCNDFQIGDANYPGSPSYNNAWSYDYFAGMVAGTLGTIPLRRRRPTVPPSPPS